MSTKTLRFVPELLKEARENAGLTQQQVADQLGLSGKSAVSNFETGFSEPRNAVLIQLCKLYGIEVESLFQ